MPLAFVTSAIFGTSITIIGMGLGPSNRSLSLGIGVLLFPVLTGIAFNHCLGAKRPWRSLLLQFLGGLALAATAWTVNYFRWYA
ncbi:MAG: hypothetical protein AAGC68_09910 [Verrucomicrobiota bacterium]